MKRNRKFFKIILSAIVALLCFTTMMGYASCEGKSWRSGVFTTLSLSIVAENGNVSAVVRNDFTLGFATVKAYVYLYSSETYSENVEEMEKEASDYTDDLNIFSEIKAVATAREDHRYWRAKLVYREDNNRWTEICTATYTVDARSGISL